jgi:predicted nuclease of predicted toxin-antitoxin system
VIFDAARQSGALVMTKDGDFVRLLADRGPPPKLLWIRLVNTSNSRVRAVLESTFERAVALLKGGESIVEIRDEAQAADAPRAAQHDVAADEVGPAAPSRPRR